MGNDQRDHFITTRSEQRLDLDAGGFVAVTKDELGLVFGAHLLLRAGEALGILNHNQGDLLLCPFARDSGVCPSPWLV